MRQQHRQGICFRPADVSGLPGLFGVPVLSRCIGVSQHGIRFWIRLHGLPVHQLAESRRGNHKYEIYRDEFVAWLRRTGRLIESDAQVIEPGEAARA